MRVRRQAGGPGGFTLLEVLIAVGAVALISVSLAAVFAAIGRTVTTGRRLSVFNAHAAMIEQRMREDIGRMTRDGFLVIRNEYADADGSQGVNVAIPPAVNPDSVSLGPEDLSGGRLRRIDELMFFSAGDFRSAREPIHPQMHPRSSAARVYYGHGKRMMPDPSPGGGNGYLYPRLDEPNSAPNTGLGYRPGNPGIVNPNRYAADWILLRHGTLLAPPRTTTPVYPTSPTMGLKALQMNDGPTQVSLQPAVKSLFRTIALFPGGGPVLGPLYGPVQPQFSSGLVDVASTELSEVRSFLLTIGQEPIQTDPNNYLPTGTFQIDPNPPPPGGRVHIIQQWMDEALPAWSHAPNPQFRVRMRAEAAPPNYVGIVGDDQLTPLQESIRRAHQTALTASNFVPHCSEFIVEWSFGNVYPSNFVPESQRGELIWHGMSRSALGSLIEPYAHNDPEQSYRMRYRRVDGSAGLHLASHQLIHGVGFNPPGQDPGDPLTSYFGYVDPTFNPDFDGDGKLESAPDSASPTIPWAWPRYIRITMSLADPNDAAVEQSYQFIFETPGNPGP